MPTGDVGSRLTGFRGEGVRKLRLKLIGLSGTDSTKNIVWKFDGNVGNAAALKERFMRRGS